VFLEEKAPAPSKSDTAAEPQKPAELTIFGGGGGGGGGVFTERQKSSIGGEKGGGEVQEQAKIKKLRLVRGGTVGDESSYNIRGAGVKAAASSSSRSGGDCEIAPSCRGSLFGEGIIFMGGLYSVISSLLSVCSFLSLLSMFLDFYWFFPRR